MAFILTSLICTCVCVVFTHSAVSDVYNQLPGGFLPSPVKYFNQNGDQIAMESGAVSTSSSQDNSLGSANSERPQQPRLGFPMYTGTSLNQGFSSTGAGMYSPLKLDLGGLLLGAVVGLGAVLLVPKLLQVFSPHSNSYSHYGRSDESWSAGLTEMMSRMDQALAENNINTTSCMQRALCSSVQTSPKASSVSSFIASATRNPLLSFLMEGSRLQKAVDVGQSGHSCATAFPQCPFNQDSVTASLQAFTSSLKT